MYLMITNLKLKAFNKCVKFNSQFNVAYIFITNMWHIFIYYGINPGLKSHVSISA